MTDKTDKTDDKTEHDVDGLLRKNAELLAEVKDLKGRLQEAEGATHAAQEAASQAQATMRTVALERPLEGTLGGAFVAPWRVVRPLLDEHLTIEMGEDHQAEIKTASGEAVALDDLKRHVQTIPDLAAMLKPAIGGGATGGQDPDRATTSKPEPKPKVASPFGIR